MRSPTLPGRRSATCSTKSDRSFVEMGHRSWGPHGISQGEKGLHSMSLQKRARARRLTIALTAVAFAASLAVASAAFAADQDPQQTPTDVLAAACELAGLRGRVHGAVPREHRRDQELRERDQVLPRQPHPHAVQRLPSAVPAPAVRHREAHHEGLLQLPRSAARAARASSPRASARRVTSLPSGSCVPSRIPMTGPSSPTSSPPRPSISTTSA